MSRDTGRMTFEVFLLDTTSDFVLRGTSKMRFCSRVLWFHHKLQLAILFAVHDELRD